ncbi:MAG: tripartite tricarboxylate transporter TctB family protein [Rhizobiales bacterium]|nr:tripartite tricarboxylate transporter TctB family protein [Hyphomicrobiales bacterium]
MSIRAPKDFWSGVMFIAFAAVALVAARNYSLGTAVRMGPGYFPMLLGGVLAGIGVILVIRSFIVSGEPITPVHIVPLAAIVLAVALFGALLQRLGLVLTLAIVIAISAFAGRQTRFVEVLALAGVLAVFSVAVFVYGLRLPLPIWPQ